MLPSLEIRSVVNLDPESFFSEIIELGEHYRVIEDVYSGVCAGGTAFYDARQTVDLPGVEDRVLILTTTTSIPNENISFGMDLPPAVSQSLIKFLLDPSVPDRLSSTIGAFSDTEDEGAFQPGGQEPSVPRSVQSHSRDPHRLRVTHP